MDVMKGEGRAAERGPITPSIKLHFSPKLSQQRKKDTFIHQNRLFSHSFSISALIIPLRGGGRENRSGFAS